MKCERLTKLAKSWFAHVRDETMAPARMIGFMEQHAEECPICREDPDLTGEIAKITELILPESKIPKAVRLKQEEEAAEAHDENEENEEEHDNDESDGEDDGEGGDEDLIVNEELL